MQPCPWCAMTCRNSLVRHGRHGRNTWWRLTNIILQRPALWVHTYTILPLLEHRFPLSHQKTPCSCFLDLVVVWPCKPSVNVWLSTHYLQWCTCTVKTQELCMTFGESLHLKIQAADLLTDWLHVLRDVFKPMWTNKRRDCDTFCEQLH